MTELKNHADLDKLQSLLSIADLDSTLTEFFNGKVNNNDLQELFEMIKLCSKQPTKILEIEQNIKTHVQSDKNIFLLLTNIFAQTQFSEESFSAGLILKNCIKNHYAEMRQEELSYIEQVLIIILVSHQKKNNLSKKHYISLVDIICAIVKKKFFEDVNNCQLLFNVIGLFQLNYCLCNLDCLIRIFEQVDDDRMHRFVKYLLPQTLKHLSQEDMPMRRNKLLYFIQILYKNLEWAVDVDPEVIQQGTSPQQISDLVILLTTLFTKIQKKSNFEFVEERRLCVKILTMLVRDFQAEVVADDIIRITIQNLAYFFPIFCQNYNTEWQEELQYNCPVQDHLYFDQIDSDDFLQENQAYIAQILQLLQTVLPQSNQDILDGDHGPIILELLMKYCMMSAQDISLDSLQDPNGFLITFLETDEDQFNKVSIRLSTIEFFEELGIYEKMNLVEACIEKLYQSQLQAQENPRVPQMLAQYTSVIQVDLTKDIAIFCISPIQLQEIALFMMGEFRDSIKIPDEFVEKLLQEDLQTSQPIIMMRILWLLERLSSSERFLRTNRDQKLQAIFEKLTDLLLSNQFTFVCKYQCLRTLYKYTKKLNLKLVYADKYQEIIYGILTQTNTILSFCNEETVHIPIQALTYYTQLDCEATKLLCQQTDFMQKTSQLWSKFHQDGLLGEDVLDLIKIQASIPGNQAYKQVFLPQVETTIKQFVNIVQTQNHEQAQKMIDSYELKGMLSIYNAYLLRNPEMKEARNIPKEERQFYLSIFKMICEILHSYRDTYVNLHSVLTLSAYCKNLVKQPEYQELIPTLRQLLLSLSNPNVGLDESASIYVGHAIVNLLAMRIDETQDLDGLLFNCMLRVSKSTLKQCIMSYSLPLHYVFQTRQDLLAQLILLYSQKEGKAGLIGFLGQMIKNFTQCKLELQANGVASILEYTSKDLEMASLQCPEGQQLQNVLVFQISEYLEKQEEKPKKKADDDGAIDMYGDYGDYGDEDGGFPNMEEDGFEMDEFFGVDLADENISPETSNSLKKEDNLLLEDLVQSKDHILRCIKSIGPHSIQKIISAGVDQNKPFSADQKLILERVFQ